MAMPHRDALVEEIKRTNLLLEWAVQHDDERQNALDIVRYLMI